MYVKWCLFQVKSDFFQNPNYDIGEDFHTDFWGEKSTLVEEKF